MHAPARIESAPARHRYCAQFRAGSPASHAAQYAPSPLSRSTLDYVTTRHSARCLSPHLPALATARKILTSRDLGCYYPLIECRFEPIVEWAPCGCAALADQSTTPSAPGGSGFHPLQATSSDLRKPQPTARPAWRSRASLAMAISTSTLSTSELSSALKPISGAKPSLLDTFHSADPRS